ncbi:MAG: hypothetical protein LBC31_08780 [Treponema sp.]|jgi:hypothetical protein|nr:hypothetical protein [Treponema sp.]
MVLTAKNRYSYRPRFNGNRLLPDEEQIEVEIIRPTAEERNDLHYVDVGYESTSDMVEAKTSHPVLKTRMRMGKILRNHVGKITNLSVDFGGAAKAVTTGVELAECTAFGAGRLTQELAAEVLADVLSEGEKKSSASPLSLSSKDGTPKSGTERTTQSGKSSPSDSSSGENLKTT